MELLLNLLWLTLALPAIWMWCRQSVCGKDLGRFDRIRPFVLFGCLLMLLFPVVSATDDLHAMRQEMEESSPSKRLVQQAGGEKSVTRVSIAGALPALIFPWSFGRDERVCGQIVALPFRSHSRTCFGKPSSRAPPLSYFAVGA
jgi:hypothetical protein